MKNIKILDCTLRDGGYINNWNFGYDNIKAIIKTLVSSGIDYIECGFLKENIKYNKNKTLFQTTDEIRDIISNHNAKFCIMVNCGEYTPNNLIKNTINSFEIRVAYKIHQQKDAFEFCKIAKDKGYNVSLNPMHTSLYSEKELEKLVIETNKLNPQSLTVVDTMGIMTEVDTITIFDKLDKNITKDITLGFHTHNNLNLSKANIHSLLNQNYEHKIIIDSCISGMSRGAGTISTQELIKLIHNKNTNDIEKVAKKIIEPIKENHWWGFNTPFLLSAKNKCHPNYANFLISTGTTEKNMEQIFKQIPDANKQIYSEEIIEDIICKRSLNNV